MSATGEAKARRGSSSRECGGPTLVGSWFGNRAEATA